MTEGAVFQWAVVTGASLTACVCDLQTRRIPNALTVPVFAAGLVQGLWTAGASGLAQAVGVSLVLAIPFILLFVFGHGGAGDAKLMGAVGAWLGLEQGIIVLCSVLAAGVVLAFATAIVRKRLKIVLVSIFLTVYGFLVTLFAEKKLRLREPEPAVDKADRLTIPYGVAVFAGVCIGGVIIWLW